MAAAAGTGAASSSARSLVDALFQRTLEDLIKLLRSNPAAESITISRAVADVNRELLSSDLSTKSTALQKLVYIASLYPSHSASPFFPIVELLPSTSLSTKRLAYLAGTLLFHPSTTPDLFLLAIHQLHKDLTSSNLLHKHLALHLLARGSSSADLSSHLAADLVPLLAPRGDPKAIVAAQRLISSSPSSVPILFKPLVDCLSSSDPKSVSAAVSAFCELCSPPADPAPYLPLAPELYRVLVESRSNWTLIKVLKIFARLMPLEPRLAGKVADPIVQLMQKSQAKSLVFECIRTVLTGMPGKSEAVGVAIESVKQFLACDEDPNLRYLGLQGLGMLRKDYFVQVVESCRDMVARSLTDSDSNIRREALRLMEGMVLENNVLEIATLLVDHAMKTPDPEFANDLLNSVLMTCGRNVYELVVDFDWYVSLLGTMVRTPHCDQGAEIERQLVDIGMRVRDARPELVRVSRDLLIDPALLANLMVHRVLSAAAWISGEYVEFSHDPVELVEALIQPGIHLLPTSVRAVYIQAVFKAFVFCCSSYLEISKGSEHLANSSHMQADGGSSSDINGSTQKRDPFSLGSVMHVINLIDTVVGPLADCDAVEIQERASNLLGFTQTLSEVWNLKSGLDEFSMVGRIGEIVQCMRQVFLEELGPVSADAQKRVPIPDGIDLLENLSDLSPFVEDLEVVPYKLISFHPRSRDKSSTQEKPTQAAGPSLPLAEHRKRHELFYLPSEKNDLESNDYPRAVDSSLSISDLNETDQVLPVADEQAFVARKTKPPKPRPKVVKLDGEELMAQPVPIMTASKKEDPLSGAILDVLSSSSDAVNASTSQPTKEALTADDGADEPSTSRRRQHKSRNKEKHRNSQKSRAGDDEMVQPANDHKGKNKHRQKTDDVAPSAGDSQATEIPDLLL